MMIARTTTRLNGRAAAAIKASYLSLMALLISTSCSRSNPMTEYPGLYCPSTTAPIILVGLAKDQPRAEGKPHLSRFDGRPTQLFSVQISVENVLVGDVARGKATVFFFMNVDSFTGNSRVGDMVRGERDLFFLLRDSGKLRTICDGGRECLPRILTGAHPHFAWKKGYQVEDAVLELLLSRGEGATDQNMIQALGRTDLGFTGQAIYQDESYIKRLRIIAGTETRPVASVACDILTQFKLPCEPGADKDSR